MDATPYSVSGRDRSPGTLGEVLYAGRPKALVSEGEWVVLVQSVAAGDQGALHALYERAHRETGCTCVLITSTQDILGF